MKATKGVSLLEILRERGHELALVASYNVHFPFFEQVVLRRLRSGGCGYVVLLMDAGQLAASMQDPDARPQLAGREYGILPVRAPGAFHPKFVLLVGKDRARLVIGSHNLTLAGFGLNKEITTLIECGNDGASRAPAQVTWRFAREWTSELAKKNLELLGAFEKIAPWLGEGPVGQDLSGPWVLGTGRTGPSLWQQVRSRLGRDVAAVTVLGPSFDDRLELLRVIKTDLQPKELLVAIDPASTSISPQAERRLPGARFVDLSAGKWKGDHNRVHAKVFRFRFRGGGDLLVSGSANPSRQAWTAPPEERNAELVVLQRLEKADRLLGELRLDRLGELPAVTKEGWEAIKERKESAEAAVEEKAGPVEIAVLCDEGILVSESFATGASRESVEVVALNGSVRSPDAIEARRGEVLIRVRDRRVLEEIAQVRIRSGKGVAVAIVQRVDELLEDAFDDTRRALKSALSGLEGDPGQLEQLFKLVERVLFEPAAPTSRQPTVVVKAKPAQEDSPKGGLSVSLAETKLAKRLGRARAGGDLGALLDAFIFKLGPLTSGALEAAPTPHEDDLLPADGAEEDPDPDRGALLAEMCQNKARRLTRRLLKRLEEAVKAEDGAVHAVIQLAAGLGLINYLRVNEERFSWRTTDDELVTAEDRAELLVGGVLALLAPRSGLAGPAVRDVGGTGFDELSSARALLCWLAFDCGCDLGVPYEDDGDEDTESEREGDLVLRGLLLHALSETTSDGAAREMLVERCKALGEEAQSWCERHLGIAEALQATRRASESKAARPDKINPGDVVYPLLVREAPAFVVIWASAEKAGLVDLDTGSEKQFVLRYLAKAQIPGWRAR